MRGAPSRAGSSACRRHHLPRRRACLRLLVSVSAHAPCRHAPRSDALSRRRSLGARPYQSQRGHPRGTPWDLAEPHGTSRNPHGRRGRLPREQHNGGDPPHGTHPMGPTRPMAPRLPRERVERGRRGGAAGVARAGAYQHALASGWRRCFSAAARRSPSPRVGARASDGGPVPREEMLGPWLTSRGSARRVSRAPLRPSGPRAVAEHDDGRHRQAARARRVGIQAIGFK